MSNLHTCLDELGRTEAEVVAKLKALGIKGAKRSAAHCPIAEYLVSLGFGGVTVSGTATTDTQRGWLPDPVRAFALSFDDGKYPELDAANG